MRLNVDPMPGMRERAKRIVDDWFNRRAAAEAHVREAHRAKRLEAEAVALGTFNGTPSFAEEADRAGLSVEAYATIIVEKPNEALLAERQRRLIVDSIRQAATPAELQSIIDRYGIVLPPGQGFVGER